MKRLIAVGLVGCATLSYQPEVYTPAERPSAAAVKKIIYISAKRRDCVGMYEMRCLLIRSRFGEEWQAHYDPIVGLNPREGIEYKVRIWEDPVDNPPADGSSFVWYLDEVLERNSRR